MDRYWMCSGCEALINASLDGHMCMGHPRPTTRDDLEMAKQRPSMLPLRPQAVDPPACTPPRASVSNVAVPPAQRPQPKWRPSEQCLEHTCATRLIDITPFWLMETTPLWVGERRDGAA